MAFRNFEEDPFFRDGFPFEPSFGHGTGWPHRHSNSRQHHGMQLMHRDPFGMGMSPFGGMSLFGPMSMSPFDSMFQQSLLAADHPGHHNTQSFSQSTVMSFSSNGQGGAPRMYQATTTTKTGPGGIKETRKAVRDSETATQKTLVSHHIGDRSHTIERQYNSRTKEGEEHQEFINLDDSEAGEFNAEWKSKTKHVDSMLEGSSHYNRPPLSITHGAPCSFQTDRSSKRRHPSLSVGDLPPTEPSSHVPHNPMPQHRSTTDHTSKRSRVKFDEHQTFH